MRSFERIVIFVLVAAGAAFPAAAQGTRVSWISFFPGPVRGALEDAVDRTQSSLDERDARFAATYQTIEEFYVAARDGAIDRATYAASLATTLKTNTRPTDDRDTIAAAFEQTVPVPGTRTYDQAQQWLERLATSDGLDVARLRTTIESIGATVVAGMTSPRAAELASALPVSGDDLPLDLSPTDRAQQLLRMWYLQLLAERDAKRVDAIESVLAALGDAAADAGSVADLRAIASLRAEVDRLRAMLPLDAAAYALAGPAFFGDAGAKGVDLGAASTLGALLVGLADATVRAGVDLYHERPDVAFLVDTTSTLLNALSDRQTFELSRALGIAYVRTAELRVDLYRMVSAATAIVDSQRPGALPVPGDAFASFEDEGSGYLREALPWATGEKSRSGDTYRWAMLPLVSHPYSEYLLATDGNAAETRQMAETFVTQVYEETMRRPTVQNAQVRPLVIGDTAQPFQRLYIVPDERSAAALYDAFAASAQGVDRLGTDFAAPYAARLTVAGYWSHMHGLDVAVEIDDRRPTLEERARTWFELADVAETSEEAIELSFRGLIAIRRTILDDVQPIVTSSGIAAPAHFAPRLPLVSALLDEAVTFTHDPRDIIDAIGTLYGVPDASHDEQTLLSALSSDVERLVARLSTVEVTDLRTVQKLAVVDGGRR